MIPITRPELPPLEEYEALLEEIWQSRMVSNFATFAQRLEALTSDYLGVATKVVVSGDIGLILTIAALDLPNGSAVIAPSFTFNSTINAILWNGLTPVFADINPETFNLDPDSAGEAAARFDAKLIVATHVFGNPADVNGLRDVADRHGARLLFDAAHAYGSMHEGRKVGSLGHAEVFSLSGTKLVTSAEGGLISTGDPALLERLTYLRGYGFLGDYNSRFVGLNGKMSELHAALGTLTLSRVENAIAMRHELVSLYRNRLAGLPLRFQRVRSTDRTTFKDLALLFATVPDRDRVERALSDAQVQTKRYFRPCHTQTAYRHCPSVDLSSTLDVHGRSLCIPLFQGLTEGNVDTITGTIRGVLA